MALRGLGLAHCQAQAVLEKANSSIGDLTMEFVEGDFEKPMKDIGEAERFEAMLIARRLAGNGVERNKAIRIAVVAVRHSFHDKHMPLSTKKYSSDAAS